MQGEIFVQCLLVVLLALSCVARPATGGLVLADDKPCECDKCLEHAHKVALAIWNAFQRPIPAGDDQAELRANVSLLVQMTRCQCHDGAFCWSEEGCNAKATDETIKVHAGTMANARDPQAAELAEWEGLCECDPATGCEEEHWEWQFKGTWVPLSMTWFLGPLSLSCSHNVSEQGHEHADPFLITATACYKMAVRSAVAQPQRFASFKRDPRYTLILEHVGPQLGLDYLGIVMERGGIADELLTRVLMNDKLGGPRMCSYSQIGRKASPTTLRYLKFATDLRILFGSLDEMNVVEVGGGYGGLCKVLFDMFPRIASYTLYDLPDVLELMRLYHARMSTLDSARREGRCCTYMDGSASQLNALTHNRELGEDALFLDAQIASEKAPNAQPPKRPSSSLPDVFISYYALTELADPVAAHYFEALAVRAPHGLIELDGVTFARWRGTLLRRLEEMHGELMVVSEDPASGQDNYFVAWGTLPHAQIV